MSLATSAGGFSAGAGGAVGGLSLAHGGNAGMQVHQNVQANFEGANFVPPGVTGGPINVAALGADLVDKSQTSLSLKTMRNLAAMPLVSIDLYGSGEVAYFPPKQDAVGVQDQDLVVPMGRITTDLCLKKEDERAFKAVRRVLRKSTGHKSFLLSGLDKKGAVVSKPYLTLGARNMDQLRDSVKGLYKDEKVQLAGSTLDGDTPKGDDFDRVVVQVKLMEEKKPIDILPEEAVSMVLNQGQHLVSKAWVPTEKTGDDEEPDEDSFHEFPVSIAVPAWACHDISMEALLEATGGTGVIHQRSVAALCGALHPSKDKLQNEVLTRIAKAWDAGQKMREKEAIKNDKSYWDEYHPLIIMAGMTKDGIELAAIELSRPQPDLFHAIYGNYKVISSVAFQHPDPASKISDAWKELQNSLELLHPESEGPVLVVAYGTGTQQKEIKKHLDAILDADEDFKGTPILSTREEAVARGAAVLGANSHGRIQKLGLKKEDSKKKIAQMALSVQNVATCALGICLNYHGDNPDTWLPIKTIFDFDKRVPAGPFPIELSGAECAAIRANNGELPEDQALEMTRKFEGVRKIPQREEGALNVRIKVLQRLERGGKWEQISDTIKPLVIQDPEDEKKEIACESAVLELSLAPTGIIITSLQGDGKSVVQANKSARNSAIRYYVIVFLVVAFVGGFLVKSYLEEYFFDRDVDRLVAYYSHVMPDSMMAGDRHNAMGVVWKYRYNKQKLWRRLEAKYGVPVRQPWEWDGVKEDKNEEEPEVEDLDEDEKNQEQDL